MGGRHQYGFQSTLPLAGSDGEWVEWEGWTKYFNPRSPCGERRPAVGDLGHVAAISIHAPLAGSDSASAMRVTAALAFQSTLPLRGATTVLASSMASLVFQSTLPLRGATPWARAGASARRNFNPRSPCGERRRCRSLPQARSNFNPRSPCGERPAGLAAMTKRSFISIHAPLAGSDRAGPSRDSACSDFNPRSPCGERHRRSKSNGRSR